MAYGIVNVPGGAGQDLGPLETAVNAASTTAVTANTKAGNAYNQANAAYNKANTASSAATAANTRASSAYTQANAAYDKANSATAFELKIYGSTELCLGYSTKNYPIGTHSLAIGPMARAEGNSCATFGKSANACGEYSLSVGFAAITNGANSVAIGSEAETRSTRSVAIGHMSNVNGNDSVAIGTMSKVKSQYSTSLGAYAMTANANSIQLGNASSLSSITAKVSITVTSDERDKADIEDLDNAIEFLRRVRAFRYKANPRDLYAKEIDPNKSEEEYTEDEKKQVEYQCRYGFVPYDKEAHAAGAKKGSRVRVGVSAQEVQRALVDVYNDIGYANLVNDNLFDLDPDTIPEDVESHLGVSYENFIPFLIQAVQELDRRTSILEGKPA